MTLIAFITGMSGSGKTQALKVLEDVGFYCVDNMPSEIIPHLIKLSSMSQEIPKLAMGVDIRDRTFVRNFLNILKELKSSDVKFKVVFLDAKDDVIVRRYKETRRRHPLDGGSIWKSIAKERKMLEPIKKIADDVIDTSHTNIHELKRRVIELFAEAIPSFSFMIVSFGYKNDIPREADLIFDTRFLINPNFDEGLKNLDGRDKRVKEFILKDERSVKYIKMMEEMLRFLLLEFKREGKSYVTVGVGCTGGRHRSVAIAEIIAEKFAEYNPIVIHRDLT